MILKTAEEILGAMERGDLAKDFAIAVHNVLGALAEAEEGKAKVVLTLNFAAKDEFVQIKGEITEKVPAKKRKTSNFFMTGDGRLSLQHPNQVDMFNGDGPRRRADVDS
jgi:hypothetical protein